MSALFEEAELEPEGMESSLGRSQLLIFGAGPEPTAAEILSALEAPMEAEVTHARSVSEDEPPTAEDPLVLVVGESRLPVVFWSEDPEQAVDDLDDANGFADAKNLHAARRSDWAVHVDAILDTDEPFVDLAAQLRATDLVCDDTVRIVADLEALRFWTPSEIADLVNVPERPPLLDLYSLHVVPALPGGGDDALARAHTHGLERLGLPELEVLGVPAEPTDALEQLVEAVAERMADQRDLSDEVFPLTVGVRGLLLPTHDVLEAMEPSDRSAWTDLDEGAEARELGVALVGVYQPDEQREPVLDWDLSPVLDHIGTTGMIYRSAPSTRRMKALARHRLPLLRKIWRHRDQTWRVLVKTSGGDAPRERRHVWYEVDDLSAPAVTAWPVTEGTDDPEQSRIDLGGISAFLLVTPEGRWDAAHLPALARRLGI